MLKLDDLTVFNFHSPAETIIGLDWSVEFLVISLSEKFTISVVPLDLILTKKNPIRQGKMKAASGTIHRGVVVAHWVAFPVAINGGCSFGGGRSPRF